MIKRLLTAGGLIVFTAGCGNLPTRPTAVFPPGSDPVVSALPPTGAPPPEHVPTPPGNIPGPALMPGSPIVAGSTVEVTIEATNLTCFQNWDASGRCSQRDFTAASDGTLVATLHVPGLSRGLYNPEMFLVTPDGAWEYVSGGFPDQQGSVAVKAGLTYRIVVMSYGPFPDTVLLTAESR